MYFAYALVLIFFIFDIWLGIKLFEYAFCAFVRHQPPFVAANKKMRNAVANEILTHYADAQTICEIGSGHGGLARYLARRCKKQVFAVENMPFSVFVSKIKGLFLGRRCRTVWADAFEWLKDVQVPIDIVVAYLSPQMTPRIAEYNDKFGVFIAIDFEVPGRKPVRVIDVGEGCTVYGGKKYPHKLFVYEFKKS